MIKLITCLEARVMSMVGAEEYTILDYPGSI